MSQLASSKTGHVPLETRPRVVRKNRYRQMAVPADILNDPFDADPIYQTVYKKPEYIVPPKNKKTEDPCSKLEAVNQPQQACVCGAQAPTVIEPVVKQLLFKLRADPEIFDKVKPSEFNRLRREFRKPDIGRSTNVFERDLGPNASIADKQSEANSAFLDSTLSRRAELQASLMKKGNLNAEQVAQFPRMSQNQSKFASR
jgi:hypothetical protein